MKAKLKPKAARPVSLSGKQRKRNRQKSSVRAKVEFPFRIIKHLWHRYGVHFRGLAKNSSRLFMPFALSNLYQTRRALLSA